MNFDALKQKKFSFIYITTKDCNVCKILQPKLHELAKNYNGANFHLIELDDHKDASGYFMAFSIPTFLVYAEGSELIRTARHLNIEEIKSKLDRYYPMIFAGDDILKTQ